MELLNRILEHHIRANTVSLYDPPIEAVLHNGMSIIFVPEVDMYFNWRNALPPLRNKNNILMPTGRKIYSPNGKDSCALFWRCGKKVHNSERDKNGRTLPAFIDSSGIKVWYCHGEIHNSDRDENGRLLPALIISDRMMWYQNGVRHNDDKDKIGKYLPSVVGINGNNIPVEYHVDGREIKYGYLVLRSGKEILRL